MGETFVWLEMSFLMSILSEHTLHLCNILVCWSYRLAILFAHRFLYRFLSPGYKAYLDHEHKIITMIRVRVWDLCSCLTRPGGPFYFAHSSDSSSTLADLKFSSNFRFLAQRTDTPSAAFLRIVHKVHLLPTSKHLNGPLKGEIRYFWDRGIAGASKPDHFLFGGKWHIKDLPDPREELGNDPLLCAIAASTAEQMVEIFNWRIGLGIRRDLMKVRARRPYWDKNLVPCVMESAPGWCKDVGPVQVQNIVDREGGEGAMLESTAINLSPSFKERNLLAGLQFMYFV